MCLVSFGKGCSHFLAVEVAKFTLSWMQKLEGNFMIFIKDFVLMLSAQLI